jgi:hypothetical protein
MRKSSSPERLYKPGSSSETGGAGAAARGNEAGLLFPVMNISAGSSVCKGQGSGTREQGLGVLKGQGSGTREQGLGKRSFSVGGDGVWGSGVIEAGGGFLPRTAGWSSLSCRTLPEGQGGGMGEEGSGMREQGFSERQCSGARGQGSGKRWFSVSGVGVEKSSGSAKPAGCRPFGQALAAFVALLFLFNISI